LNIKRMEVAPALEGHPDAEIDPASALLKLVKLSTMFDGFDGQYRQRKGLPKLVMA